jgi:cell wall-associated NlpC family hydrolase
MNQEQARLLVVAEARDWLGTVYHHQAHIKGVGVDCAQLLVACYRQTGVLPADFDPGNYSSDWFLHRSEERYLGFVERYARRLFNGEAPQIADIALYKVGKCVSHGAILIGDGLMIHANRKAKQVEIARLDQCELTKHFHSYWSAF